eukprot:1148808-Pelagomonas_calceolata.AAC.2
MRKEHENKGWLRPASLGGVDGHDHINNFKRVQWFYSCVLWHALGCASSGPGAGQGVHLMCRFLCSQGCSTGFCSWPAAASS